VEFQEFGEFQIVQAIPNTGTKAHDLGNDIDGFIESGSSAGMQPASANHLWFSDP
jgi:hypothetical protein